jgi:predicted RNA binding protein YcfA (HicA-like mRNA interferase family)
MLARLPGVRAKELIKALEKAGFVFDRQGATSHVVLRHPVTRRTTAVPIHSKELPRWLMKKIIKDAGLSENEFRSLL